MRCTLLAILQMYEFSSKSQRHRRNSSSRRVVGDTANVRVFKQITTRHKHDVFCKRLLAILQMYEFSSKSQPQKNNSVRLLGCWRYCKCTSFQANHNIPYSQLWHQYVVGDTANVRVFKQITTCNPMALLVTLLLAILQMYEFSSKSQPTMLRFKLVICCWRYCKCTSFQANHNNSTYNILEPRLLAILQMYEFSSKSQPNQCTNFKDRSCWRYCKCTSFQANHN